MKWISLSILLICFSLSTFAGDQEDYEQAVGIVNQYLQDDSTRAACPGMNLVVNCGNQICELDKFETVDTCPSDCKKNVTVRSYNNIVLCDEYVGTHVPRNVDEVQDIVKMAVFRGKTVKPIGASHSATNIMCSEGIVVPMERLNQVIGLTEVNGVQVVETETGVTVFQLSEWLHSRGLALAGLPHMGFRDVSVGGALATGSHGSTAKHHGVISNILTAAEFVDGKGNIRYLERHSANKDEFSALSASLGLLGIMTKAKLKVQNQFNLEVNVSYHRERDMFKNGLINQVRDCDYGQLNWFPGIKKFMKTCGKRTNKPADEWANNELLQPKIPNFIVKPFKKILQLGACHNTLMCLVETARYLQFRFQPPVVKKVRGKKKNRKRVVGPSHRMVSSHLTPNQKGFFQMDWEIAVPASRAQDALVAIKQHVEANRTCVPLVGVFIRFAPSESAALISHTTSSGGDWKEGEPAVFFEMPVYLPLGFSKSQYEAYEKQFAVFSRMLIEKFSGRPHWGKNKAWTFDVALNSGNYGDHLSRFKKVKDEFDPLGTFANKFSRQIWKD